MEPWPVELMNTVRADRDGVHDTIADPAAAARWLRAARPEVGITGWEAVAELRDLRDALRRLAAAVTEDDRPSAVAVDVRAAAGIVNRACARAPSWSELRWPGTDDGGGPTRLARTAHAPALAAIAGIAEEAVALFTGPDRLLLRACHAPGCVLYFIRNHPRREWCSDGCGNRARVARHYRRHHGGDPAEG